MVKVTLPRFVAAKTLAGGVVAFYWSVPAYWRKQKCPYATAALGKGLSQTALDEAAKEWNDRFDGWRQEQISGETDERPTKFATVGWLFAEYLRSDEFRKRVGDVSRPDYRRLYKRIGALPTLRPDLWPTFDAIPVKAVSPLAADKIYAMMCEDGKLRRGEKTVTYCKIAWKVMARRYPTAFRDDKENPWEGLTTERRTALAKAHVDREMVYTFAWGAIDQGRPELAAAAVACFEWLQRPMNVTGGMLRWTDYRSASLPHGIKIEHHKTGAIVPHPLQDQDGTLFYEEAEEVLAKLPRRGIIMILGPEGQRYQATRFAQLVRRTADRIGLPKTFTLDACRHGGMTELEEAELTDGQGRALSAHRSRAYERYAKRTEQRMLAATRRRIAYRVAGAS